MLSIDELEKKWYRYRMKKLMAPTLGLVAFSFILTATGYYVNNKGAFPTFSTAQLTKVLGVSKESSSLDPIILVKSEKNTTLEVEKVKIAKVVNVKKELDELVLEPIIPVLDFEKETRTKVVKRTPKHTTSSKKLVKAKANVSLTASELAVISKVQKVNSQAPVPRTTKKMNFQSTNVNYTEAMKSKFLRSKNPREAVLLAKAYFKEKNYKESEKWALTANKINSSLDESWLIFAKSKAKLGKKKEALRVLVSYYKKSHSTKAKVLIGQIQTGKI